MTLIDSGTFRKTDRSMVIPSLEILGTKFWGVVLNDSAINGSAYYGSYDGRKHECRRSF